MWRPRHASHSIMRRIKKARCVKPAAAESEGRQSRDCCSFVWRQLNCYISPIQTHTGATGWFRVVVPVEWPRSMWSNWASLGRNAAPDGWNGGIGVCCLARPAQLVTLTIWVGVVGGRGGQWTSGRPTPGSYICGRLTGPRHCTAVVITPHRSRQHTLSVRSTTLGTPATFVSPFLFPARSFFAFCSFEWRTVYIGDYVNARGVFGWERRGSFSLRDDDYD